MQTHESLVLLFIESVGVATIRNGDGAETLFVNSILQRMVVRMMRFLSVASVALLAVLAVVSVSLSSRSQQRPPQQQSALQPQSTALQQHSTAPFAPLNLEQQAQLQQILLNWQKQSEGTKTLACNFTRWHYDSFAAPPGIHASKSEGVIKYAAPDKGLFRVDQTFLYAGMKGGKPHFREEEYCNGEVVWYSELIPFVFNRSAEEIQRRFWVRIVDSADTELILVEAWPKRREDRARYKLAQIALDPQSHMPETLVIYPPNFHQNHPVWDHYEFTNVKRNGISSRLQQFFTRR